MIQNGRSIGFVVTMPDEDKMTVHAVNPKDPASPNIPHFPTQHGERLETRRLR